MSKAGQTAITPTRKEDYPEWYQQVIKAADLAENSSVRGCMVIKPWGFAIWELMQRALDDMFKATGHVNAYFPLFIPLSFLAKEAEHIEGFAKECAVVTHHRLEAGPNGGLVPAGELDEPLVVRPTSEMIIGATYAKWVQSYRDLPILINQWANVVRWEMRTRLFLRTTEFLWQEGHTVHATAEEAIVETKKMLDVYSVFAEEFMAMPVIKGEKAAHERFPGAVDTYTIEAMMQDGKALQSGTSHFLGQNFAKAMSIKFQNEKGEEATAWTTSWGASTRLIGGLIMCHSDDDGLVLPPRIAPKQVVILPIYKGPEQRVAVIAYCQKLKTALEALRVWDEKIRVDIDDRDLRGGDKAWQHIKKGVPIRLEIGPRDMDKDAVFMGRRDLAPKDKLGLSRGDFLAQVGTFLTEIQNKLLAKAKAFRAEHSQEINSLDEFKAFFSADEDRGGIAGFAHAHWSPEANAGELLAELKVTHRCIPVDGPAEAGICIFSGKHSARRSVFARSY